MQQLWTNLHQFQPRVGDKPGSMRAVIDPRPILQRRENFRNWFSALRCILLTNNCGQSFSQPPAPPTKTSKVPSNQRALHFALGPTWQLENEKCLCCLVKNVAALGLVWLPLESRRQMTRSTCALPSARIRQLTNSKQPPGNDFQKPRHQTCQQQVSTVAINNTMLTKS